MVASGGGHRMWLHHEGGGAGRGSTQTDTTTTTDHPGSNRIPSLSKEERSSVGCQGPFLWVW